MTDPRLTEAINTNPRWFIGVNRISDLFELIKKEGPISQRTILASGFSKTPMQKGLDILMRSRLISSRAIRNGDMFTIMYQERKENAS